MHLHRDSNAGPWNTVDHNICQAASNDKLVQDILTHTRPPMLYLTFMILDLC